MKKILENGGEESRKMKLSVIIPFYNEDVVLEEFYQRLSAVFEQNDLNGEFLFVNDGSEDNSLRLLNRLREKDGRISIIDLSRNFGKEIAMTAGLDHAKGDAVILIDADLQDPPELIPDLINEWHKGYDVVYAQRTERGGESLVKKITSHSFYRLMQHVGHVKIPRDTGDFRLLSRRAVEALNKLRERNRFMKGLYTWIGYPQKAVPYKRDPRFAGETKWNYWRLWNFALDGVTSFSTTPLKAATYLGLLTALGAFLYASFVLVKALVFGDDVPGFPTLMIVILFLGGVQLIALGIIGEYLGRAFDESKYRPLYLLKGYDPSELAQEESE